MAKTNLNEDKIALLTGCFIFLLAALNLAHLDVLGWVALIVKEDVSKT